MTYKVWWMVGEKIHNFGDVLTPKILDYYNIKYEYSKDNYNMICVGSVANKAKNNCIVVGSGVAWEKIKLNKTAIYKCVRGPYTRNAVINSGGNCPDIYGDPALLLPEFCSESKKEYDVGIIPHMKEYAVVAKKYNKHHVINLNNKNPLEVAQEISKCRKTISSSLHGIIASHAFNIPCAWVKFSDIIIGDDTKFKDHYASINLSCELSTIENPKFASTNINYNNIKDIFLSLK
jgi:hypothetical protein